MEGEDEQKFDNLPIKVRQSRLTALGKEFPNKKDFLQPNKLDNVDEYETVRQGHGKGASTAANLIEAHMLGSEKFPSNVSKQGFAYSTFYSKIISMDS